MILIDHSFTKLIQGSWWFNPENFAIFGCRNFGRPDEARIHEYVDARSPGEQRFV